MKGAEFENGFSFIEVNLSDNSMFKYLIIITIIFCFSCSSEIDKNNSQQSKIKVTNENLVNIKNQADSLYRRNNFAEAEKHYYSILKIDSNNDEILFKEGKCLSFLKKYEEANNYLVKTTKLNSSYYDSAFFKLGHNLILMKKYSSAFVIFGHLISRDSTDYKSYRNRGVCFLNMGQTDRACADLQKAYNLGDTSLKNSLKKTCHGLIN